MGKKKEVDVPGLPAPWKAYYSDRRERVFYFNSATKKTTWDLSDVEQSSGTADLSKKEADEAEKHPISKPAKKEHSRRKRNPSQTEEETNRTTDKHYDTPCVPGVSDPSEELMEVDEIGEVNRDEEPMEIDFVVGEVKAFRRAHFLLPDLVPEGTLPTANATKYVEANETTGIPGEMLIVFDTSCLLQDATLLPLCIQRRHHALIPYTVLRELDGLKKATSEELRQKTIKTNTYLHDCIKRGCSYLHVENMFEASSEIKEFDCKNNDEVILKCAYVTTRRYEKEAVAVVFATNDKILAVKAAAHNIITADRNELLLMLENAAPPCKNKWQQAARKISPSDFSFAISVKPSSSATGNDMQIERKTTAHGLSSFTRNPSPFATAQKSEVIMQNAAVCSASAFGNSFYQRNKKGNNGCVANSAKQHIDHQTPSTSYSVQKTKERGAGSVKSGRKRKVYELSGYSLDDFLETVASLVECILQRRVERKAIEDAKIISRAIDSVISNATSSLSVLIDIVSKFYDFYADRDVFVSATHFDKKQLMKEFNETSSKFKEKLREFQRQLPNS